MQTKNVTCNHCHKPFTPIIETSRASGGGEHWHFTCPHCHHNFTVCTITAQGVALRHQLNSIKSQLLLAPHNTDLVAQSDALLTQLSAEITDLTGSDLWKHQQP